MIDSQNKAKRYAFKLLSYRGRSEKELKERLERKGISKTVTSSTVQYLKRIGLVDDRILAEHLKREAISMKFLSYTGAKNFIMNRGIPREIVDQVLTPDETLDIHNARRLIHKKMKSLKNYPSSNVKKKAYGLLSRRGYSSDIIHKVLRGKIFQEEDI